MTLDEVIEVTYSGIIGDQPDQAERLRKLANLNLRRAGFNPSENGYLREVYSGIQQLPREIVEIVVVERRAA